MKRQFLSAVRVVLPFSLACVVLATTVGIFPAPSSLATWASLRQVGTTAYGNVIVVAKSGGDFLAVQKALNSITDNSPTNRYLVWVAPGTYTETITMKPYVDIEGAGEQATRIAWTGSSFSNTGTVVGASNAELRYLTVSSFTQYGVGYDIAIYNNNTSPSLQHVTAIASTAMSYGILNTNGSSPNMASVTAIATAGGGTYAYGVANQGNSSPTMKDVTASASGGIFSYGVYNNNASPTMRSVAVSAQGGIGLNYGVYNAGSSPKMDNVNVTISDSNTHYGVYNSGSFPMINGGTIALTGGSNHGVHNEANSSPTISGIVIAISGGGYSYGIYNNEATVTIENSNIHLSGGASDIGIYNALYLGSFRVTVDNSTIVAGTNTISNSQSHVTRVGASKLEGGPVLPNGGVVTCAGVYDENYVFFPNTCP